MDKTCELALRQAAYMELFRIVFLCGGYPFQQLAFGYSKIIYGNQGDNTAVTARMHGNMALSELAGSFLEDYLDISGLDDDESAMLRQYLLPLQIRLTFMVIKVLALDRASRIFHKSLLFKKMSATCLRQYYEKYSQGFTDAIPDWSKKLETRIRHVLGAEKDMQLQGLTLKIKEELAEGTYDITGCSRCKLRHLPPCIHKIRRIKKKGKKTISIKKFKLYRKKITGRLYIGKGRQEKK